MDFGGGGGGGFTVGGDTEGLSSSQSTGARNHSVRPVTIKQLLDATQVQPDVFRIDGSDIGQVTFVGHVRNVTQLTTTITYKLDDGTGEIDVRHWLPDKEEGQDSDAMDTSEWQPAHNQVTVNGYARVLAKFTSFGNKRSVNAVIVKPIKNINEYHCHFLEATAVHLYFTRGLPPSKQKEQQEKGLAGAGTGIAGDNPNPAGGSDLTHMSSVARKLYQTLATTPQGNEGLHVQHLSSEMGVPINDVVRAADELVHVSKIYSTVDEVTFAILPE